MGNISIKEKDLINLYIDFDLIKNDKWNKSSGRKKRNRYQIYANKNPNSTGNLATISELYHEENIVYIKDALTVKNRKINDIINSSGSDSDHISEGVKNFFTKIKGIFDRSSKTDKKKANEKNNAYLNEINDINDINNNGEPVSIFKEYFIYPEKNSNLNIKFELPIEFIILIKKMENVKTLTFQIN